MNEQLLREKADVVARCLARVKSKRPASQQALAGDLDAQDIIILNLERAVQACVDISSHVIAYTPLAASPTMAESFVCLRNAGVISPAICERMVKATGLRNLLVHEYQRIDWNIVWQVLNKHIQDPIDFVQAVLNWRQSGQGSR